MTREQLNRKWRKCHLWVHFYIIVPIKFVLSPITKYWWIRKHKLSFQIGEIIEYHHPEKFYDTPPYYLVTVQNIVYHFSMRHTWIITMCDNTTGKIESLNTTREFHIRKHEEIKED